MRLPIPLPPLLSLGSDDEYADDDAFDVASAAASGAPLPAASGARTPTDRDRAWLSDSGTFTFGNLQLRATTGLKTVGEDDAASPDHMRPTELGDGAMALHIGSLSALETLEPLGSGASGTVYKARHVGSGALVAVKCVRIVEKSKRDQVLAELKHMRRHTLGRGAKWLVHMHDAFYESGRIYTVLEHMDGGDLERLVATHAPAGGLRDERELSRIARGILEGLDCLHRTMHQVHRDLKPANVLLSRMGAVKISDFGISRELDSTLGFATTFVGTTCYMSPERLAGDAYTYSADLWSFGLMMFELATATFPYPKPSCYFALLTDIVELDAPALPDGAGFTDACRHFLGLCLQKEPLARPSAAQLLAHPWLSAPSPPPQVT